MADILNTYPVFESNQVLTSTQLNSLVNYLDQQNRLTRTRLIGMGVVCGLELDPDSDSDRIILSKGTGITSEGYLISIGECIMVKYRDYTLPPGTIYEPFVNASTNEMDIKLWELLTDDADDEPGVTHDLSDDANFLIDLDDSGKSKILLLFIESYDKDLKSCLGKSCDELGKERILTVRKLLITQADLATVWARTNTGKLDASFPEKFDLPVINMPRVLFNPSELHSSDYDEFSENYADAILNVFDDVFDALKETYSVYRPLLLESYDEQDPFDNAPIDNLQTTLLNFIQNTSAPGNPYLGIQYVYDLFLDLIAAYNEFKTASFDLMSECTPDMSRFPKHLMLGEAVPAALTLCENSEFRHYFVQPPVYNLQSDLLQRTIALHNKMVLMLESFDLERVNAVMEEVMDIRITPSNEKVTALSLRSIPWYYDPNLPSSYNKLGRLKDYWNYDVSRKCPLESDGLVLNYEDQSSDMLTVGDKLSTPLYYDIQDYPFLRIEGHISKDFEETVDKINELKSKFNLPFKTLALQLDTDVSALELDYSCGFEDIQEEYVVLRASFCNLLDDILGLYKFVEDNKVRLFDNNNEGDGDQDEIDEYLESIRALLDFFEEMCEAMADCVQDFDFEAFQDNYKEMLTYVIDFFLEEMELMNEIEINEEDQEEQVEIINKVAQMLFPVLYKILDLFFYNRFLRIYYSFKRREYYLRKETSVFSTFIEKHPGVDHQAGVPKGGTFIIVYNGGEDPSVIGDFNLPYLCCTEDRCVPACDEDGFVFEVLPFARPDYAITTPDVVVEIDVKRNDGNIIGGDYSIQLETGSEIGAVINVMADDILEYKPPSLAAEELPVFDHFTYSLTDNDTGISDIGNVTVLVKEAGEEEEGECYSIQILQDWDNKNDGGFELALEKRRIKPEADEDKYQLLLDSLRLSCGFTLDELQNNILEGDERKRNLLESIPIQIHPQDDLQQLILNYQASNCGVCCFTIPALRCWAQRINDFDIIGHMIKQFRDHLTFQSFEEMLGKYLLDLRATRGFAYVEVEYMGLEMGVLHDLVICLGLDPGQEPTFDELLLQISNYQIERCGADPLQPIGATEEKTCYNRDILKSFLDDKGVIQLLKLRKVKGGGDDDIYQLLLNDLSKTGGFTDAEINQMVQTKKLGGLLKLLGFKITKKTTDDAMIELINTYQADNCGNKSPLFEIDFGLVPVKELRNLVASRGGEVDESSDRKEVEKAASESKGGNKLTKSEAEKLTNDTLKKILGKKDIAFKGLNKKADLVMRLLG